MWAVRFPIEIGKTKERMIDCILLAAGNAVRFGENKLMYPVEGVPMAMRAISLHAALPYHKRVLITQKGYEQIAQFAVQNGFQLTYNERPERGLGSSVRTAIAFLRELGEPSDGILFGVCDQPYLNQTSVEALCKCFSRSPERIAVLASQSRRGNPVIFPRIYLNELSKLDDDKGGIEVVKAHPEQVDCIRIASDRELRDIDRKQEADP